MKTILRLRKASTVRGSPYTNPLPARRAAIRVLKRAAKASKSDVNVPGADATPLEEEDSAVLFSEEVSVECYAQDVVRYLTRLLTDEELKLLVAVRGQCKGLKDGNFDLPQATHNYINAEYLKGLINVVPARGTGDRTGRFCVSRFTIEMYCKLLEGRQITVPSIMSHARLNRFDVMSADMAQSFQRGLNRHCIDEHWLLLVEDLRRRRFLVYDSLVVKQAAAWTDLSTVHLALNARVEKGRVLCIGVTSAELWLLNHPPRPTQGAMKRALPEAPKNLIVVVVSAKGAYFVTVVLKQSLWSFMTTTVAHTHTALKGGPPYLHKAMDVINALVVENQELRDMLMDERNSHLWRPHKAMDVIDALIVENQELRDMLIDERNSHLWMQCKDMAVDAVVRADLARTKLALRFAVAAIILLIGILVSTWFPCIR
ncbi:hypothetical protein Cgig2_032979 [Carnegiea gigantea]|uniref:Uncharacterized protein n=1 Tax=Carnegiea gigantea TaxID=171969 RepID=A0A9Q1JHZ5_9CARY|nr:hypothetical protein Cgig2_032979 [Carnegiea gigantea]